MFLGIEIRYWCRTGSTSNLWNFINKWRAWHVLLDAGLSYRLTSNLAFLPLMSFLKLSFPWAEVVNVIVNRCAYTGTILFLRVYLDDWKEYMPVEKAFRSLIISFLEACFFPIDPLQFISAWDTNFFCTVWAWND